MVMNLKVLMLKKSNSHDEWSMYLQELRSFEGTFSDQWPGGQPHSSGPGIVLNMAGQPTPLTYNPQKKGLNSWPETNG